MKDYMIRGTLKSKPIRFFLIDGKNTVAKMKEIHDTSPNATAAAGRSLLATAMIGYEMKNKKDIVNTIIDCDGEMRKITCTANNVGSVKCDILNPHTGFYINEETGKLDVAKVIGSGTLRVIKDLGFGQPYSGEVPIISGEISEDYTYYFALSDQTPSVVSLGVYLGKEEGVTSAGGMIIQLLPGAEEEDIVYLEEKVKNLETMTAMLKKEKSIEDIVTSIFSDAEVEIADRQEVNYECNCSKEKIEKLVLSLGKDEIEDIIKKDEGVDILCHFCKTNYHLSSDEVKTLAENAIK